MKEEKLSQEAIRAEIAQYQQRIKDLQAQLLDTSHVSDDPFQTDYLSEQRFQILLDTASIAIVVVGKDGKILTVNRRASEIFGYSLDELMMSPVGILLPQGLRETHEEHLNRFFANPRPRPMGQGMDLMAQRQDGTLFPIEVSLSAIQSEQGTQGVAFIVDITERKRNELRFSTLLDTASIAIVVVDNQGKMTTVNQKAAEIFGYASDELVNAPVGILLPQHLRETHEEHLNRFFANPRPRPMGQGMDLMAQRQNGTLFPIEVSLSAIQSEQGTQGVAFIVDISERKRAEQQQLALIAEQERVDALQNFVLDVAHDLKTPMAALMTRIHIIDTVFGEAAAQHTAKLTQHVERLNHLVDTMLVMTQLDMIEQLNMQTFDVNQVIHHAVDALQTQIQSKQHHLTYNLDTSLPPIKVHQQYLTTAVKNILANAIIFTPQGGHITLTTGMTERGIVIAVQDDGMGIAETDLPHIFKRFYRADRSRSMDESINGLGLAIAKRIVDLHHGEIAVESEVSKGSTFRLLLPVVAENEPNESFYLLHGGHV